MTAILRQSAVDPRNDGPTRVIADIAAENPRYLEDRAVELVREAQAGEPGTLAYHEMLCRAIGLLAMARAVHTH